MPLSNESMKELLGAAKLLTSGSKQAQKPVPLPEKQVPLSRTPEKKWIGENNLERLIIMAWVCGVDFLGRHKFKLD